MRSAAATVLLALYGASSYWAYFDRTQAFLYFALASVIALPFVIAQMIQRLFIGIVVGALLTGLSVVFPPAALIAMIFGAAMLVTKFQRFARNLPYLATSCGAYAFLWFAPRYVGHEIQAPGADRFYLAAALPVAGILVLLLFIALMSWVIDASYERTVLFTFGYGWYLAFFLVTFLIPDGDGGDADWDD